MVYRVESGAEQEEMVYSREKEAENCGCGGDSEEYYEESK